jgi:hypothetical protein
MYVCADAGHRDITNSVEQISTRIIFAQKDVELLKLLFNHTRAVEHCILLSQRICGSVDYDGLMGQRLNFYIAQQLAPLGMAQIDELFEEKNQLWLIDTACFSQLNLCVDRSRWPSLLLSLRKG